VTDNRVHWESGDILEMIGVSSIVCTYSH